MGLVLLSRHRFKYIKTTRKGPGSIELTKKKKG